MRALLTSPAFRRCAVVVALPLAAVAALLGAAAAARAPAGGAEGPAILSQRDRALEHNRWLKARFETILPALMRREQIDMWVVICREHHEDPMYFTLVPQPSHFAWRLSIFAYVDRGAEGVERLVLTPYGSGDLHREFAEFYRPAFEPEALDPWARLARLVQTRNPKRIAVNESETFAFADGLTASSRTRLAAALGPELASRLVSSERLAVGWLETRSPAELDFYPGLVALTHRLVAEAFSRRVITPGTTTIDDLAWWVRERIAGLGVDTWFQPMFYVVREASRGGNPRLVEPGDLLRCDIGVKYMGLVSDIQQLAYVPREGETEPPRGLTDALAAGNRLQDLLVAEMRPGRTGNEVLAATLARARAAGLDARVYSHPIGYHGHGAGSRIGLPDMQDGVPGMGDYPLFPDTVWAIELNVRARIPEWGDHPIVVALEEDAALTDRGVRFLDGRQTVIRLVR